jgi:hypothetical protein
MTLLSNAFIATPSTAAYAVTVNDQVSVDSTLNSSTKTPSQVLAMTIRKKRKLLRRRDRNLRVEILLTSTIRHLCQEIGDHLRARRMASSKRRSPSSTPEYRDEEDGSPTPAPTVRQCSPKRSCFEYEGDAATRKEEVGLVEACGQARDSTSVCSIGPLALDDQIRQDHSTPSLINDTRSQLKRKAEHEDSVPCKRVPDTPSPAISEDNFNEKDPFGLDEFFRSLRTCRVGGSKP